MALAAVALQDHLVRSLKIGGQFEFRARPVRETVPRQGRPGQLNQGSKLKNNHDDAEHEYVLDKISAPLTLGKF